MLPLTHPQGRSVTCLCASRARVGSFLCTRKGWGVAFSNASRGGEEESRFYAPACQGVSRFLHQQGRGVTFLCTSKHTCKPFMLQQGRESIFYAPEQGYHIFMHLHGTLSYAPASWGWTSWAGMSPLHALAWRGDCFFMHQQAGDVTS